MERETGIEPATLSLEGWCSANWATPAFKKEKIIDNGRYPISKFSNFLLALFKPNSSEKIYHRNVVWTIQSEFSKRLNGWDNRSLASLVERGGCARSLRSLRLPLVADLIPLLISGKSSHPPSLPKKTGGEGRIRTSEGIANRFTVCPLWPLGNLSDSKPFSLIEHFLLI